MKLAGKTDVGLVRQDNQDDYRAGQLPGDAAWALVCDGMGGARGGREASQSACDVIERCFQEHYNKCLPGEEELFLKRTLVSANRFVFQKSIREESLAGMGTTAVCALVRSGKAYLCHAGDSRAYLFRDGSLAQLRSLTEGGAAEQGGGLGRTGADGVGGHAAALKQHLLQKAGVHVQPLRPYQRAEVGGVDHGADIALEVVAAAVCR